MAGGLLTDIEGTFYREVDREKWAQALAGSRGPGRYSREGQPTLYLSASRAGVEAAMQAHRAGKPAGTVLAFDVRAHGVFDLRLPEALSTVRREAGDPLSDWQTALARGDVPGSWRARDWIEATGAKGLIDPSRRAPGLWHLVLFRWNSPGAATVTPCPLNSPDG